MRIGEWIFAKVAVQLGRPEGAVGRVVGRILNRGNRSTVLEAVAATGAGSGAVVADIGFGGGVGLEALLRSVGEAGVVHGVEISETMLAEARRRFRREIDGGRLVLHEARMDGLPFADASLDGIVSTNTVYFIEDLAGAFRELRRVLKLEGRAVLAVGDPAAMERMPFTQYGFRLRPIGAIEA